MYVRAWASDEDGVPVGSDQSTERGVATRVYGWAEDRTLERLLEKKAKSLMLTSAAFWWLKGYETFIQRLDAHYRCTCGDEHCIIYRLDEPEADSAWAG